MKYGYDPEHDRLCPCYHCNKKPNEPAPVGYKALGFDEVGIDLWRLEIERRRLTGNDGRITDVTP